MNNEPVAWMIIQDGKSFFANKFEVTQPNGFDKCIPLYTHQAKYCPSENNKAYEKGFIDGMQKQMQSSVDKFINGCVCGEPLAPNTVHRKDNPCYVKEELTEDEILSIMKQISNKHKSDVFCWNVALDFARTILKKAQEK